MIFLAGLEALMAVVDVGYDDWSGSVSEDERRLQLRRARIAECAVGLGAADRMMSALSCSSSSSSSSFSSSSSGTGIAVEDEDERESDPIGGKSVLNDGDVPWDHGSARSRMPICQGMEPYLFR